MNISGPRKKLLTEINMVPFIDVVLVLLIIFMIMSPFIAQSQIAVRLPKAVSAQSGSDDNAVTVQVTRDGDFSIGGHRVLRKELSAKLGEALDRHPKRIVLIEADRDVSFKNVVLALDAAEQLEASKVGVGVLQTEP